MIQPLEELATLRKQRDLLLSQGQVIRGIVEAHCFKHWQACQYKQEEKDALRREVVCEDGVLLDVLAAAGISLSRDVVDEEILHVCRGGKRIDSYHEGVSDWMIQCQKCRSVVVESTVTWKNDQLVCEDCARA